MSLIRLLLALGFGFVLSTRCTAGQPCASESLAELLAATCKVSGKDGSGTCFLLAPPAETAWPAHTVVVVTAAHALENVNNVTLVMRQTNSAGGCSRREITLTLRSGERPLWIKHPDADVAAMKFEVPPGIDYQPWPYARIATTTDFSSGRITLGAEAEVFCYPAQLEACEEGLPILRHAWVATLPQPPLDKNRTFIVDFNIFGGDSGAPVMVAMSDPKESPPIAGIIVGMHRQTDKVSMPFEERTVHHPLGLAIAVHSVAIREVVDKLLRPE